MTTLINFSHQHKPSSFSVRANKFFVQERVTIGNFILCTLVFLLFKMHAQKSNDPQKYLHHMRSLISLSFHVLPVLMVALLYLTKHISMRSFALLLGLSRGYMLYDIPGILWFEDYALDARITYLLHHLFFFVITYYVPRYGDYIAKGLLSEITNVPLEYVLCYRHDPMINGTVYFRLVSAFLLGSYFILRVCNFSYLMHCMRKQYIVTREGLWEIVVFIPLCAINYYWFYLLVRKARFMKKVLFMDVSRVLHVVQSWF